MPKMEYFFNIFHFPPDITYNLPSNAYLLQFIKTFIRNIHFRQNCVIRHCPCSAMSSVGQPNRHFVVVTSPF
jgi:hypothetical protein